MLDNKINFNDVKHILAEEYFKGEYAAQMFTKKYCHVLDKENDIKETPAEVFWRVASGLASMEKDKAKGDELAKIWFSLMWTGVFRPGGSILSGIGAEKGRSLLNCTTLPIEEDSLEGIAKCDYEIMKCAAFRQGLGFDGSILRPRTAPVANAAEESTGAIPWIEKLVDNGEWVGQKGRKPALLVSLNVKHPDIIEFITAKSQRGAIENANISVQITNEFMEAIKVDGDWELRFDFEGDRYPPFTKTVKAIEIFDLIADTACSSAEPGVQFIDLMRDGSMVHQVFRFNNDDRFKIISTNACSEKPLPKYGCCNLLSINQEVFPTKPSLYKRVLSEVIPYLVRLADNVVEYELTHKLSPLDAQAWILAQTRELGFGVTNLHGWLLKQDLAYDSDEAIKCTEQFSKYYAKNVFMASVALGKEKGNAPAWDAVSDKSVFMNSIYFKNIVKKFYGGDVGHVVWMRNLAHMSQAPTGSISDTFPMVVLGSGNEPNIGPCYWRRTRAIDQGTYTHYFIIPERIQEYILKTMDSKSEDYKTLSEFSGSELDDNGKIGIELKRIVEDNLPEGFFKAAHDIDPLQKIKLMAGVYKWMDACVSCTYNLPIGTKKEVIKNIYLQCYAHGVRAASVYVEGSREGILIFEDPITNAKKFTKTTNGFCKDSRPETITLNCAPKRPESLPCDIIKTSIQGKMWTVLVGLLDGMPFEVFCGQSDDLYLPDTCKEGILKKQASGVYSLEVSIRRVPMEFKDLAKVLMTDNEKALTRLLSLNLRHGVHPQFIVDQLKKTDGDITEFSTAISRVLSKYVGDYILTDGKNICPVCDKPSLMFAEGCIKCAEPDCGYSRCG